MFGVINLKRINNLIFGRFQLSISIINIFNDLTAPIVQLLPILRLV